jgi:hypothetical protein
MDSDIVCLASGFLHHVADPLRCELNALMKSNLMGIGRVIFPHGLSIAFTSHQVK